MTGKKLLPYIGIPFILTIYLALKLNVSDYITISRAVILIFFGYFAAYLDIKIRKVPNKLVIAMLVAWLVLMAVNVIIDIESATQIIVQSLIGSAAAGGFFGFLYIISRKGIGGGDVKFVTVTGLFLTLAKLLPMLFLSSLLAAIVSAILLITKRATMKTAIPLVPFLYLGMLIIIFM